MAFVNLTAKSWGSSPDISIQPAYEMQRSGANMQYRIRVTVGTVTGQSYFGFPIYLKVYLQSSLKDTHTLKSASPSQWSSNIVYTSDWFTIWIRRIRWCCNTWRIPCGALSAIGAMS